MSARADLHVHSRHSNRPDEWLLRRIAAPESFTDPLAVYRLCRERGMDFVTLSDHDTIEGALEIAHLPGTFLSSEVTVTFPEDGCRIHCLVSGITEAQHREIQRLRSDVYAFRDYLYDQGIVYSVAHPLYRVNDRLTLAHLAAGDHAAGGEPGSALRLAQSLFAISYRYFQERFSGGLLARNDPFAELLRSLGRPTEESRRRWWLPSVRRARPAASDEPAPALDQVTLERANRACAQVLERFARRAAAKLRMGRIGEALGTVSQLAPLVVAAPYAVARTIRQLAATAGRRGRDLSVLTCGDRERIADPPVGLRTFEPLSTFPLPGYEGITPSVPPFLELLDHCERRGFDELVVSTPGPLGLAGLAAGRLLGLRVTGVYHTDFPLYVRHLTDDPLLEEGTWAYMRWLFGQMDRLLVPSAWYLEALGERGFDRGRMALMPRGVDRSLFHPGRREDGFWRRYGLGDDRTLLYVGRVSEEKNLEHLLEAFHQLRSHGHRLQLAVVGDGPHRNELAKRTRDGAVAFTGFLHGPELAEAVARLLGSPERLRTAAARALETARAISWDALLDLLWTAPGSPSSGVSAGRPDRSEAAA